MDSEVYVEFSLTGIDLNPEDITSKVGIEPTKTWLKDELISPKGQIRYKQNGWKLRSHLEASDDLDEHFRVILQQLRQGWQPLIELCSVYEAEFCGVIYTSGERPAIHFDRELLKAVLQLNAEIDVDLYVLPDHDAELNATQRNHSTEMNQASEASIAAASNELKSLHRGA
ncbi:DUF4279 domain-containing protein [Leptolyngbya boryana CZ1]|jgi:hypothetical protein|uniref:DUF4279 domain-containing protein n=2 Tax=Leptolyngbya boryana TaxID=1184 RepID=A0A1Z4JFJ9_LEPBY|nr:MULTISPECIES: DUF4279 domain-containing protein [Leptolyngbya]BAY55539.1 hypothetical protein NIES2135_23630 [Leptolyngbya boryana NIES-2135]MBD2368310.1 DUF4279 domain-containing protein [Leptolyngbya sp. FACHB-161]MBD2375034.1 DUF4279 domain-containing protein [Leptolyngbya sp. FACHB-238]MBD2399454.1 DUF4279 domain-containing protein [Leptolyngbya sp. FACHB-239]MBD2405659.1 DUF4279 domain-containing protein [Leptolyngbya sp. FACHB-402]